MNSQIDTPEHTAPAQTSTGTALTGASRFASKKPIGALAKAIGLAGFAILLAATTRAHEQPPGCTGSGLGISLFSDRQDAHIGETICYSVLVFNTPFPACLADNVVAGIVTPDGVTNRITLRRTTLNPGDSDYYTNVVCYTVRAQDVRPDSTVRATAFDTGRIHQNETDSAGGGFQGVNTVVAFPCLLVTKECVAGVGESGAITFTGTVRNCGNVPLVGVTVTNFVNGGAFLVFGPSTLETNQTATFQGSYVPINPCLPTTDTLVAQGRDTLSFPSNVVSSVTATCQNILTPAIQVTQVCPPGPISPGQLVVYSGTVTNSGNVTLTNVVVVSDQPAPNTQVFAVATLAPGAVANFTGSYPAPTNCVTTSSLTVRATSRCGVAVTNATSATCPILTAPQIAVTVVCPPTPSTPGGVLAFTGTVRNPGNITLTNIVVVSDRPAANTVLFRAATLAPGASVDFNGSLSVPAGACAITALVSASGNDLCTGALVTNAASLICPVATTPRIAVTLVCPATPVATGSLITFSGTVSNPGNIALTNVVVVNSQPAPNTVVLTVPFLAPGASTNFVASITTALDACSVTSTVTASGSDACSGIVATNTATATCPLVTAPRIVVTQNCPTDRVGLGGTLTYSGTVSNAGNVTLTNIVVVNDRTGNSPVFTVATLAPGAVATFTGSYPVPATIGCAITSTVTASGSDRCTGARVSANAPATCLLAGNPQIAIDLLCPTTPVALGGTLAYRGTVRNAGNITLTNIVIVSDSPVPGTVVFRAPSLAPGATATYNGTFVVPATNACSVTTSVTASGTDQCVAATVVATAAVTCPLITAPRIAVTQVCPPTPVAPGGLLVYSGTVSNPGNITLTNITVVSSLPVPNTAVFTVATLAPGASANFTGSFNAPLDACSVASTLTATGRDQCTGTAVTNTVTTTCPLVTAPSLALTKICPPQPVAPGGTFVFAGTVTNTGNITVTGITIVNNQPVANTVVFGPITLAPGTGTNFTGSYRIPANVCTVTDTLTATGRDRCTNTNVTASVTTTCPVLTTAQIRVTKLCPPQPVAPGGLFTFTGTVSNPGNITLTNVVVVNPAVPNQVVLTLATLAPGASANFTGSYTVTTSNVCSITDTVTASGQDQCGGQSITDTASTVCPLLTAPSLAVTKICPPSPVAPGGLFVYSGTVTNTGNITLTNVIVVDNLPVPNTPVFGPVTLVPGQGAGFSGSFTMPTNNACVISDTLTATGADQCTGRSVTANATTTCPVLTTPRITVTKNCPPTPVAQGAVLAFTGTVRNSGNITLTNIVVVNNQPAPNTVVFTLATLAPGATANFSGSYRVPSNCCSITDTLAASGKDICTGVTVTDTATRTCPVLFTPGIAVTKTCMTNAVSPGQVLTYTGTVSNPGNITLVEVFVVDNQPTNNTPVIGPLVLTPGETVRFTGRYVVPMDFCGTDTVTARGTSLCGDSNVVATATSTCRIITSPSISVTKNCPPAPVPLGSLFTFTGTVRNNGDVTLTNVIVVNNQPTNNTPVIGPITLAPGASADFTGSYVTPPDCCEAIDTLTARGQDRCTGTIVSATASQVCPLQTSPAIRISKVCPTTPVPVGGLFVFSGTVTNTGNITLLDVFVVSNHGGQSTEILGPIELAPGETESFEFSYTVTAGSNPATDTVTARGRDLCTSRTVIATANCGGITIQSFPSVNFNVTLLDIAVVNGMAKVSWAASPGLAYYLQFKSSLADSDWLEIPGHVMAEGSVASKEFPIEAGKSGFYRIRVSDQHSHAQP